MPDWRVSLPDNCAVLPVEVTASQRTSVVTDDHTVGVQHWHQFKDELLSQLLYRQ